MGFVELTDTTDVVIDGSGLAAGSTHSLILETFDANRGIGSTSLRMDTVQIRVLSPVLPTFTEELPDITLNSGLR